MTKLVYLDFSDIGGDIRTAFDYWYEQMPIRVREKIGHYHRWQDALNCLAGNVLVLHLLRDAGAGQQPLQQLSLNAYGRPFLEGDGAPDFNVSHSGRMVIGAVCTDGRIGVDIEEKREVLPADFATEMLPDEYRRIRDSDDPATSFFSYWTQKEAVAKANGKGLSLGFRNFFIEGGHCRADGDHWYVREVGVPAGHICHVATDILVPSPGAEPANHIFFNLSTDPTTS